MNFSHTANYNLLIFQSLFSFQLTFFTVNLAWRLKVGRPRNNWKRSMVQELGRVVYSWEKASGVHWRIPVDTLCSPVVIKDNNDQSRQSSLSRSYYNCHMQLITFRWFTSWLLTIIIVQCNKHVSKTYIWTQPQVLAEVSKETVEPKVSPDVLSVTLPHKVLMAQGCSWDTEI